MSQRVYNYIKTSHYNAPRLVVDLDLVRERYLGFASLLPDTRIFYAVKANPAPKIIDLLVKLGACFDAASWAEIDLCLQAGAKPENIAYGNTIKKSSDIEKAYQAGIMVYSFDCISELDKIAAKAPNSKVIVRILCDGAGADWPLSHKFGTSAEEAEELLEQAKQKGLIPYGVSFHVGSQQGNSNAWDKALESTSHIFKNLREKGIELSIVNLGGGFPAQYTSDIPHISDYTSNIVNALRQHFGNRIPETIIEPGRGLVGDAGIIQSEIVLISDKPTSNNKTRQRWVYLDIGKFGGLAETMDEAIRYKIRTSRDNHDERIPCVLAGPTCDSVDVLYEKNPYMLPVSLEIGETVFIEGAGAYTSTYATNYFNGFAPLETICI